MSRQWEPVGDLGDPQLNREVNMLTAMADDSPARWWWLSFCDPHKPEGERFLGVAIVRAPNEVMAMRESHAKGCNPGGEMAMFEIPEHVVPGTPWCNRLLSREELEAMEPTS